MKKYFLLSLFSLFHFLIYAQSNDSTGRFGFTLNSSLNGELYPIRIVPSLTYIKGKSQLELGFGFHPFIRKDQKMFSGELNHKYFPNGTENKFNTYLIIRFSYINNRLDTYYPSTYNYLFLNGGYGMEIKAFKGFFVGTNISAGTFTYSKKSSIPYEAFADQRLFYEFGFNLAFQFNIGYRF